MELIKIQLQHLKAYCESEQYRKFRIKPISPLRIASFTNNPRGRKEDIVLYVYAEDDELIAFSSVLADEVLTDKGYVSFGWCTNLWTHPGHRGKKLWKSILQEQIKDWDGKVMYTNYAPITRRLYSGTGWFHTFYEREGIRFYLYPDLNKLLKERSFYGKVKYFLPLMGQIVKAGTCIKRLFYKVPGKTYAESFLPDDECWSFVERNRLTSTFNRGKKEIEWIADYPWVTAADDPDVVFPFSYTNKEYKFATVRLYDAGELEGFFIYTVVDGHMRVLYYYGKDIPRIAKMVSYLALENRIQYLTVLEPGFAKAIKTTRNCFVYHKKYISNIYATFEVSDPKKVFDGDGDTSFT